jgi:hypothetical protein
MTIAVHATLISQPLRASLVVALLVLLSISSVHAQSCSVSGVGAPNAAGNSIPIWTCDDGPSVSNRYISPPLPDVFGAIAVDTSMNYGTAWNYKSEDVAKTEALRRCKAVAQRSDCRIAVLVADVCISLSVSKINRLYAIGGPTGAVNYAEANSNLHCQRAGGKACVIATSFCADGIRHTVPLENGTSVPLGRSIRK